MFWILFILCIGICIPGIYFMVATEKRILEHGQENIPTYVSVLSHSILIILFSGIGAILVPKIELLDPLLSKLVQGNINLKYEFLNILQSGLIYGTICSVGNILIYYIYLYNRIDREDFIKIEKSYKQTGIASRVFYGGIVEEVLFRWGVMTLFVWIGSLITGKISTLIVVISVILSSVIFALIHLPGIKMIGVNPTPHIYTYSIGVNIWVGIFCGIAFWKEGILAAIIVHILFHLLWYPIQSYKNLKLGI